MLILKALTEKDKRINLQKYMCLFEEKNYIIYLCIYIKYIYIYTFNGYLAANICNRVQLSIYILQEINTCNKLKSHLIVI